MTVDLFSEDLDKLDNEGKYSALEQFCAVRLNEGWRLDYTEEWNDRALEKVAAFANTFGGVLIIGVKKDKTDPEPLLIGVNSAVEYKTRIASSIAANISPVPSYHVYECHRPKEPNSKFCVLQIRNTNSFHLLTKKNMKPIRVRNEDEDIEANASEIRRLLERSKSLHDLQANLERHSDEMFRALRVRNERKQLDQGRESFSDSQSFFKIVLVPHESRLADLEKSDEKRLKQLVRAHYPRVASTDSTSASRVDEERASGFFEWVWYHNNSDWEMRWRITADGQIAQSSQICSLLASDRGQWSAFDLCEFLFLFLHLSSAWWEQRGYFGDGVVFADLATNNLPIFQNSNGAFGRLLNPSGGSRDLGWISSDAIQLSRAGRSRANASQRLTPALVSSAAASTVVSLSNTLLRNLGHLVDIEALGKSIGYLQPPRLP